MRNFYSRVAKAFTLIVALFSLPGLSGASPIAEIVKFDLISVYCGRIAFDVLRNGTSVGFHTVNFDKDGREVVARSTLKLLVEAWFITPYKLAYTFVSRWRNGQIVRLNVSVNDNGTAFSLGTDLPAEGSGLRVQAGANTFIASQPVYPTDHWNPGVLNQIQALNTLTGRINRVAIERLGRETVPTELGVVEATHYDYTGDLKAEVWYDDMGRWVKMRLWGLTVRLSSIDAASARTAP